MPINNEYLYSVIKKKIIEYIKDLPTGSRIPTRTEFVEKFNVTRTTIDRAISELIGEGYFYSKIGSGTYIINNKGSAGVKQGNISWGILLPSITRDIYPEIIRAVEDVCSVANINLIVCNTDNKIEKQEAYIRKLVDSAVSGIVIVPAISSPLFSRKGFEILKESNVKFIFCNRGFEGYNAPKVVSNDFYGGNIATKHLLSHGWKKPAFISKPFYSVSEQRYNGYLSAIYESKLHVNEKHIHFEKSFYLENSGYAAMKALLELPEPPDSVFCFNDVVATGAYLAIEEKGKKVGADIGVIGYDDTHICESLKTKLTSVRFPKYEIGKKAAEILFRLTQGEEISENYSVVMQPTLVIRDSCGEGRENRES